MQGLFSGLQLPSERLLVLMLMGSAFKNTEQASTKCRCCRCTDLPKQDLRRMPQGRLHHLACYVISATKMVARRVLSRRPFSPQSHGWDSKLLNMSPGGSDLVTSELVFLLRQYHALCESDEDGSTWEHQAPVRCSCSC